MQPKSSDAIQPSMFWLRGFCFWRIHAARDYIKHNAEQVGNILHMGSQKSSKEKKTMGSV